MDDRIVARSRMAEVEEAIGIPPVEELLAERQQLVERVAELRARHGSFGTFDALRKSKLATIKMLIRAQAQRDGRKADNGKPLTNDQIEDEAHAHPDYTEFVIQATRERADLTKAEGLIANIDATIQRANVVARYATAEVHL